MNDWRASGSYFEVCNCDAPCPCRRIGGRPGGSFPYDTCDFALSWRIDEGHFGATSLENLDVAMAGRWDDAEPPWHVILYIDGGPRRSSGGHSRTSFWAVPVERRPGTTRPRSARFTRSGRRGSSSTMRGGTSG